MSAGCSVEITSNSKITEAGPFFPPATGGTHFLSARWSQEDFWSKIEQSNRPRGFEVRGRDSHSSDLGARKVLEAAWVEHVRARRLFRARGDVPVGLVRVVPAVLSAPCHAGRGVRVDDLISAVT